MLLISLKAFDKVNHSTIFKIDETNYSSEVVRSNIVPGFLTHIYVLNGIAVGPVFSRLVLVSDKVQFCLRTFSRCTLMILLSYLIFD